MFGAIGNFFGSLFGGGRKKPDDNQDKPQHVANFSANFTPKLNTPNNSQNNNQNNDNGLSRSVNNAINTASNIKKGFLNSSIAGIGDPANKQAATPDSNPNQNPNQNNPDAAAATASGLGSQNKPFNPAQNPIQNASNALGKPAPIATPPSLNKPTPVAPSNQPHTSLFSVNPNRNNLFKPATSTTTLDQANGRLTATSTIPGLAPATTQLKQNQPAPQKGFNPFDASTWGKGISDVGKGIGDIGNGIANNGFVKGAANFVHGVGQETGVNDVLGGIGKGIGDISHGNLIGAEGNFIGGVGNGIGKLANAVGTVDLGLANGVFGTNFKTDKQIEEAQKNQATLKGQVLMNNLGDANVNINGRDVSMNDAMNTMGTGNGNFNLGDVNNQLSMLSQKIVNGTASDQDVQQYKLMGMLKQMGDNSTNAGVGFGHGNLATNTIGAIGNDVVNPISSSLQQSIDKSFNGSQDRNQKLTNIQNQLKAGNISASQANELMNQDDATKNNPSIYSSHNYSFDDHGNLNDNKAGVVEGTGKFTGGVFEGGSDVAQFMPIGGAGASLAGKMIMGDAGRTALFDVAKQVGTDEAPIALRQIGGNSLRERVGNTLADYGTKVSAIGGGDSRLGNMAFGTLTSGATSTGDALQTGKFDPIEALKGIILNTAMGSVGGKAAEADPELLSTALETAKKENGFAKIPGKNQMNLFDETTDGSINDKLFDDATASDNAKIKEFSRIRQSSGSDENLYDTLLNYEGDNPWLRSAASYAGRMHEAQGIPLKDIFDDIAEPLPSAREIAASRLSATHRDLEKSIRDLEKSTGQKGLYNQVSSAMRGMTEQQQVDFMGKAMIDMRDRGVLAADFVNRQNNYTPEQKPSPVSKKPNIVEADNGLASQLKDSVNGLKQEAKDTLSPSPVQAPSQDVAPTPTPLPVEKTQPLSVAKEDNITQPNQTLNVAKQATADDAANVAKLSDEATQKAQTAVDNNVDVSKQAVQTQQATGEATAQAAQDAQKAADEEKAQQVAQANQQAQASAAVLAQGDNPQLVNAEEVETNKTAPQQAVAAKKLQDEFAKSLGKKSAGANDVSMYTKGSQDIAAKNIAAMTDEQILSKYGGSNFKGFNPGQEHFDAVSAYGRLNAMEHTPEVVEAMNNLRLEHARIANESGQGMAATNYMTQMLTPEERASANLSKALDKYNKSVLDKTTGIPTSRQISLDDLPNKNNIIGQIAKNERFNDSLSNMQDAHSRMSGVMDKDGKNFMVQDTSETRADFKDSVDKHIATLNTELENSGATMNKFTKAQYERAVRNAQNLSNTLGDPNASSVKIGKQFMDVKADAKRIFNGNDISAKNSLVKDFYAAGAKNGNVVTRALRATAEAPRSLMLMSINGRVKDILAKGAVAGLHGAQNIVERRIINPLTNKLTGSNLETSATRNLVKETKGIDPFATKQRLIDMKSQVMGGGSSETFSPHAVGERPISGITAKNIGQYKQKNLINRFGSALVETPNLFNTGTSKRMALSSIQKDGRALGLADKSPEMGAYARDRLTNATPEELHKWSQEELGQSGFHDNGASETVKKLDNAVRKTTVGNVLANNALPYPRPVMGTANNFFMRENPFANAVTAIKGVSDLRKIDSLRLSDAGREIAKDAAMGKITKGISRGIANTAVIGGAAAGIGSLAGNTVNVGGTKYEIGKDKNGQIALNMTNDKDGTTRSVGLKDMLRSAYVPIAIGSAINDLSHGKPSDAGAGLVNMLSEGTDSDSILDSTTVKLAKDAAGDTLFGKKPDSGNLLSKLGSDAWSGIGGQYLSPINAAIKDQESINELLGHAHNAKQTTIKDKNGKVDDWASANASLQNMLPGARDSLQDNPDKAQPDAGDAMLSGSHTNSKAQTDTQNKDNPNASQSGTPKGKAGDTDVNLDAKSKGTVNSQSRTQFGGWYTANDHVSTRGQSKGEDKGITITRNDGAKTAYSGKIPKDIAQNPDRANALSISSDELNKSLKSDDKASREKVQRYYDSVYAIHRENGELTTRSGKEATRNSVQANFLMNNNASMSLMEIYKNTGVKEYKSLATSDPELYKQLTALDKAAAEGGGSDSSKGLNYYKYSSKSTAGGSGSGSGSGGGGSRGGATVSTNIGNQIGADAKTTAFQKVEPTVGAAPAITSLVAQPQAIGAKKIGISAGINA